jgi:monofunctional biosynthetic peptidoglycan transglycosylase
VGRLLGGIALIALLAGGIAIAALVVDAGLPDVGGLARRAPERTSLMKARAAEAARAGRRHRVDQRWVSYERISPLLRRAVLIAEDDAFFAHGGLDWTEMERSARENLEKKRIVRGGSTITQQLAKNLYLGHERTIVRKLKEILLAIRIERTLSKRRIFELYLNLIEWGDGIYGVEAAARRHFGVPASALDARQAALLAAVIINPRRYSPQNPDRRIQRRMRMILGRMLRRGAITRDQFAAATGDTVRRPAPTEWMFGPPADTAAPESLIEVEAEPDTAAAPPDSDDVRLDP